MKVWGLKLVIGEVADFENFSMFHFELFFNVIEHPVLKLCVRNSIKLTMPEALTKIGYFGIGSFYLMNLAALLLNLWSLFRPEFIIWFCICSIEITFIQIYIETFIITLVTCT